MAGAAIGETAIPFDVVAKTIANRVFHAGYPLEPLDEGIVWSYRLSRAVVAACCGASLALAGAVLQSLLRNPLADPYILGISAGASTGAVAVALLGIGAGFLTMPVGALIGALLRSRWSAFWRCVPATATAPSFWPAWPVRSCSTP